MAVIGRKRKIACVIERVVMQIEEANDETSNTRWFHDILTSFRKKIGMNTRKASEIPSAVKLFY